MKHSVLILCDYKALYGGNFIPSVTDLALYTREKGSDVGFIFGTESEGRDWLVSIREMGFPVYMINKGGLLSEARQVEAIAKETNATIIHAHFGFMTAARITALKIPSLRLILHQHSDFSAGKSLPFKRKLKLAGAALLDLLLGKRLLNINVGYGMKRKRNTVIIPNALSVSRFDADRSSRSETRRSLGIADQDTFVLLLGWSPYVKGVDIAVNAMQKAPAGSGLKLGIVCGREYTEQVLKDWIQSRGLPIRDDVVFLQPTEEIYRYYKACDIMLSASRSETFAYSILETLLAGKWVVMSDIPGTAWAAEYPIVSSFRSEDPVSCLEAILDAKKRLSEPDCPGICAEVSSQVRSSYCIRHWSEQIFTEYERISRS